MSSQSPNKTAHAPFKGVLTEQCQLLFSGVVVLFVLESISAAALAGFYWNGEVPRSLLLGWLATVIVVQLLRLPLLICAASACCGTKSPRCRVMLFVGPEHPATDRHGRVPVQPGELLFRPDLLAFSYCVPASALA